MAEKHGDTKEVKINEEKCEICNSPRSQTLTFKHGYAIFKCLDCGFVFVAPTPTEEELKIYYNYCERLYEIDISKRLKIAKGFDRIIKKYSPDSRRILEIGCSTGYILDGLRKLGYSVKGTELSSEAVKYGRKVYGIEIDEGEFPNSHSLYDAIILCHIIEHIPHPYEFIKKASQYLDKNGIILIMTPNVDSINFKIFRNHWSPICPPGHLSFFNRNSMEKLLKRLSLDISLLETKTDYGFYNIVSIFIISLLSLIRIKRQIKNKFGSSISTGEGTSLIKLIKKIFIWATSIVSRILFIPVLIIDKLGYGENLIVIARKKINQ